MAHGTAIPPAGWLDTPSPGSRALHLAESGQPSATSFLGSSGFIYEAKNAGQAGMPALSAYPAESECPLGPAWRGH